MGEGEGGKLVEPQLVKTLHMSRIKRRQIAHENERQQQQQKKEGMKQRGGGGKRGEVVEKRRQFSLIKVNCAYLGQLKLL